VNESEAARLADAWDARVRANRLQVDRIRLEAEADDFYAPVSARFIEDPRRTGDAVVDALLELAQPGDRWLDIGAGAGRYALPLALAVREVVAVEPSPAMRANLRSAMDANEIRNVTVIDSRWPPSEAISSADVALIAHVGYDVEPITPFLDAMEAAVSRCCVAVLMDEAPASYAHPFWPLIHGMERDALPALGDLVALVEARGARAHVRRIPRPPRTWTDSETLVAMLRHQLWIPEGGPKDSLLRDAVAARAIAGPDGLRLPEADAWIGVVDWIPPGLSSADG
jgi:SAM-dependent methyltransferase